MQVHKIIKLILLIVAIGASASSCYYDNEQELYPSISVCDTTNITFSNFVKPMVDQQCKSCHGATSPSGGLSLIDYTTIKASVASGKFYNSVTWASGISPMPQGGNKWTNCDLLKLKNWIDKGAQNN